MKEERERERSGRHSQPVDPSAHAQTSTLKVVAKQLLRAKRSNRCCRPKMTEATDEEDANEPAKKNRVESDQRVIEDDDKHEDGRCPDDERKEDDEDPSSKSSNVF